MTESKPARKRGGHAYGRRNSQISNTAEEGELCIYAGHANGRFSNHSMRYDSHAACVRCVASAREGRMSLDIDLLLKKERQSALKFWSNVDIGAPDQCWDWHGNRNPRTGQPVFSWRRTGISKATQHHPQRIAMWLSWGDLGYTGVKTTCGNRLCCNPFHLIPQNIGVYVDQDAYLSDFDLQCQIQTLKQQVGEYNMEQAIKEQAKADQSASIDARAALLLSPDTSYAERFEAVLTDMLEGRHITQTDPDSEALYREIIDHQDEEDNDNPTKDF